MPGACTKRINVRKPITISFPPQQYAYRLAFQCSKDTEIDFSADVPKNRDYSYTLPVSSYRALKSFTCIGSVYPSDRAYPTSAMFEIRFIVINENYLPREGIYIYQYKGDDYLVLGSHAKYSTVWDGSKKSNYKEKTVVKVDSKNVTAFSESHNMRYSYYGL